MVPMSPSKVAELRKGKRFKEKGDNCVVWDEDTGNNKRRREKRNG